MGESQKLAESLQAWVQLLIALTPLGAILVKLIRDLRQRTLKPRETPAAGSVTPLPQLTPAQRSADLAIALSYAALFSLLWTYALGMSGRILEWRELAGVSLGLALLIGVALVLAWIHRRTVPVVAGFAVLSYLLLVIAPGGVFLSRAPQASSPVFFLLDLTLVAGTFLLYLRGQAPVLATRRRWAVPAVLGVLCAVGAVAGGLELTRSTFADHRAPLLGDDGRRLFRTLGNTSLASQRLFYQLASELVLVPFYRAQYLAPPAEVSEEADEVPVVPGRRPAEVGESLLLDALELPEPEVYMVNRLRWVHPLGAVDDLKAGVPMPGHSAEERLASASQYRIFKVLSENRWLQPLLDNARYSYSDDIRSRLEKKQNVLLSRPSAVDSLRSGAEELLPGFTPHSANLTLKIQMALPVDAEGRIAFAQYRKVALGGQRDPRLALLVASFERLPPEVQRAYIQYIAAETDSRRFDLLSELSVLAAEVRGPYSSVADVAFLDSQLGGLLTVAPSGAGAAPATGASPAALPPPAGGPAPSPTTSEGLALTADPAPSAAVEQLAGALRRHFGLIVSREVRKQLVATLGGLLQANDAEAPVLDLLRSESLEFAGLVQKQGLSETDLRTFFEICADPVSSATVRMLGRAAPPKSADDLDPRSRLTGELVAFKALPREEQESILGLLAHRHYRERPEDFFALALANAQTYGYHLDVLLATALYVPLFVVALLLVSSLARALSARDVLQVSVGQEVARGASPLPTFAIGLPVVGRENLLRQLGKLARKGWGTIALVGQRGIGKTRVLQELLLGDGGDWHRPDVGVWIVAPARFDERDFISSALDQVATQVERAVAHHLGAQPLAARRLEARLRNGELFHFGILAMAFWMILLEVDASLPEPLFALALAPTVFLMLAAACAGALYLIRLQPVDLGPWLQARQAAHSQAVLMYREAIEVLSPVSPDSRVLLNQAIRRWSTAILICWVSLTFWACLWDESEPGVFLFFNAPVFLIWLMTRRRLLVQPSVEPSLMTLLRTYREYVASVVRRIGLGAFGEAARGAGVVMCIDELDKITDLEEIREFVRRIKGIFEVPGVYYYLSLAEDAFGALYLGSVDGKNEIDSSFDHVVRVQPLDIEEATKVVAAQCGQIELRLAGPRLARAIAVVTFGVPRDALRLCGELATQGDEITTDGVVRALRNRRELEARLAYELRRIEAPLAAALSDRAEACCATARQLLASLGSDESRSPAASRVALSCWILAMVEQALESPDEALWREVSALCADLGGQIALVPLDDLTGRAVEVDDLLQRGAGEAVA